MAIGDEGQGLSAGDVAGSIAGQFTINMANAVAPPGISSAVTLTILSDLGLVAQTGLTSEGKVQFGWAPIDLPPLARRSPVIDDIVSMQIAAKRSLTFDEEDAATFGGKTTDEALAMTPQQLGAAVASGSVSIGAAAAALGLAAPGTSPQGLAALGLNQTSIQMALAAPFSFSFDYSGNAPPGQTGQTGPTGPTAGNTATGSDSPQAP